MPKSKIVPDEWVSPNPRTVADALSDVHASYWICAGLGLDLFVGWETRSHHDADVAILRSDQSAFRSHLEGWDLCVAIGWQDGARVVVEWPPGELVPEAEGAVWCRPAKTGPWMFELLLNDGRDGWWHFKRNPGIQLPIDAIGAERDGIPFLNPEIILLHKATSVSYDTGDGQDFETVLPFMSENQKKWLARALATSHPNHPWLERLEA